MIIGDKTLAWFDIWSIEHFISGATLGSIILIFLRKVLNENLVVFEKRSTLGLYLILIFGCSYVWEAVEHYLEEGLLNASVTFWFHGVEFWGNRLITDPILVALGSFVYLRWPRIGTFAYIFSTSWVFVHVLVFPHCMYLQELLFGIQR
jgi:hypothetical protein